MKARPPPYTSTQPRRGFTMRFDTISKLASVITLMMFCVGLWNAHQAFQLQQLGHNAMTRLAGTSQAMARINQTNLMVTESVRTYAATGDSKYLDAVHLELSKQSMREQAIGSLRTLGLTEIQLAAIQAASAPINDLAKQASDLAQRGEAMSAKSLLYGPEYLSATESARIYLDQVNTETLAAISQEAKQLQESAQRLKLIALGMLTTGIIFLLATFWFVYQKRLIKPILDLASSINKLASGENNVGFDYLSDRSEIGLISRTLNDCNLARHRLEEITKVRQALALIGEALPQTSTVEEFADVLLAKVCQALNCDAATFYLRQDDGQLRLLDTHGLFFANLADATTGPAEELPGVAMINDTPGQDHILLTHRQSTSKPNIIVTLPIVSSDKVRAVIELGLYHPLENWQRLLVDEISNTAAPRLDRMIRAIRMQQVLEREAQQSTFDLKKVRARLEKLVENGILLGRERDRHKLLRHILVGAQELTHCAAGTVYLKTKHESLYFAIRTNEDELPSFEMPLYDPKTGEPRDNYVSIWVAINNKSVVIDDVYTETRFDLSGTKKFSEESGFRTISMLTVPMSPREGHVIGVLQLLNAQDPETGEIIPFQRDIVDFVEALATQSAVALENHELMDAQLQLMDSIIRLLAGAIDAKSAYTGGHCERVPELAIMLAQEACKIDEGPLAEFKFETDDEWREFRIGAWLHDCGKVTTPEYVVDKASKLETIYNRIHEIRMRFEVLLRDAQIERLESIASGVDPETANQAYEVRKNSLLDDFAFIAECNIGGEFMAPERVERLKQIGAQTWLRHFDDRLGLAHEELQRYAMEPAPVLPTQETLLADKAHHILPRGENKALDAKYGFKLKVPQNLYNHGELYNLSIGRGTLTEEDRFKINEHIIQTIVMLENMPFPDNMKRVPEYAGTHHETLIGTGYPRKLTKDELSIPSRIMAIADIFEALTASDRPYKKANTLSESIKILSFFKKDQHIDPDIFELFLRSGIYRRYAEKYLRPEQIDEVDISKYL